MQDDNVNMETHKELISVPKDVWNMILNYLRIEDMQENIHFREARFNERKELVEDTLILSINRLTKVSRRLVRTSKDIDHCVDLIELTDDFQQIVTNLDDKITVIDGEVQTLNFIIQNLFDCLRELSPCIIEL